MQARNNNYGIGAVFIYFYLLMHCVVCKTSAMYTVNFSCTHCFGETFSPTTAAAAATNTIATTGITCTIRLRARVFYEQIVNEVQPS